VDLRGIARSLGLVILLGSSTMALPLLLALFLGEAGPAGALGISLGAGLALGAGLVLVGRKGGVSFRQEALAVVALSWVLVPAVGALPYFFSGAIPGAVDALFESVSGFTTTGASVVADVESWPRSLLFWRGLTQWIGGLGIVVVFVALFPAVGAAGRRLFRLEVTGIDREAQRPRVRDAALALLRIYLALSAACFLLLLAGGLPAFDAVVHTFAALATGGFSTRNASVGAFANPFAEVVLLAFMLLAGVNFGLYDAFVSSGPRKGWRLLRQDPELRLYLAVAGTAAVLVAGFLLLGRWGNPAAVAREAAFNVVSIQTSTGFASSDFDRWPHGCRFLLLGLMLIGGCAGSTAGGPKVVRILVLLRAATASVRRFAQPRHVVPVTSGGIALREAVIADVGTFLFLWVVLAGSGAVALSFLGMDLVASLSSSLSCLSNTGPGLGAVGPMTTYADVPQAGKALLAAWMLLGRLEILAFLALFRPWFWRG
jgi:trk system potassium uptake protein TrkH